MSNRIAFLLVILLLTIGIIIYLRTRPAAHTVPTFPVYPNAELMEQRTVFNNDSLGEIYFHYKTPDTTEQVFEYYNEIARCNEINETNHRQSCQGNAEPLGTYSVYLEYGLPVTTFIVELGWYYID